MSEETCCCKGKNKPSKSWCYTLNHPQPEEINQLIAITDDCSRHRCTLEEGENGTPHLQGAITFRKAMRLTALKKLNKRIHWEITKSEPHAYIYCTKGEIIIDKQSEQGKRNDILQVQADINSGMTIKEIADKHFNYYMKYKKNIEAYFMLKNEPRNFVTEVIVLWGESETGKTRTAIEDGARKVYYANGFFYGAVNADVVLFDEFDECEMSRTLFLEITDRYECTINVKGGESNWRPKKIYLTSNINPKHWKIGWDEAIRRRITKIVHLKKS